MTKLPSVTIESMFLSNLFFNFRGEADEMGTKDVAKEFISLCGLEDQVTVEELVADFRSRE